MNNELATTYCVSADGINCYCDVHDCDAIATTTPTSTLATTTTPILPGNNAWAVYFFLVLAFIVAAAIAVFKKN